MKKVDWKETLKGWIPSVGAVVVSEPAKVSSIAAFCNFVAERLFGSILLFGDPLTAKRHLEKDGLSKSSVFEIAATQILEHGAVWETHLDEKSKKILTYEFPIAINGVDTLRYMKIQIPNGVQGLASPCNVKKVFLRYHASENVIEVKYVQD